MPKDSQNQHVQSSPHPDGVRENFVNDSTASAGAKLSGVANPKQNAEFGEEKNPYNYTPKHDPMMDRFEKLVRGNKKT